MKKRKKKKDGEDKTVTPRGRFGHPLPTPGRSEVVLVCVSMVFVKFYSTFDLSVSFHR